jgi:hypothetical protein
MGQSHRNNIMYLIISVSNFHGNKASIVNGGYSIIDLANFNSCITEVRVVMMSDTSRALIKVIVVSSLVDLLFSMGH